MIKTVLLFMICVGAFSCIFDRADEDIYSQKEYNISKAKNPSKRTGRLKVHLISPPDFDFDELILNASRSFPDPVFDKVQCSMLPLPIFYYCYQNGYPSVRKNIGLRGALNSSVREQELSAEPGIYYASIGNGFMSKGLRFSPVENKKIFISFGYRYEEKDHSMFYSEMKERQCSVYRHSVGFPEVLSFLCPEILIKEDELTEISIQISDREFNDLQDIVFPKFLPGLVFLGPITNVGYYMKRDFKITVKNP